MLVHEWAHWRLVAGSFVAPDGERFERSWVRSPGAVGVVALDDAEQVVLVRQYRPALGERLWELPAGLRDVPGEQSEATARRELREETGVEASEWSHLGRITSAPGITDSDVVIFLASGLSAAPAAPSGPEERHMEVRWFALSAAVAMVRSGEITDSKTVAGLLLVESIRRG